MQDDLIPQEIRTVYADYINDVIQLEATRKPTDGLLGFGKKAGDDPCHDRFASRLEQELNALATETPSSETVSAVLHFVFNAPNEHKELKLAFWMLQAVSGLTEKLIVFLSPQDAADLLESFSELYPKRIRLPVQQKIAKLLNEQAGERGVKKRRGLNDLFKGADR
ncbi:MAG: hypothetical protein EOM51_00785 [Clostridia bacterium]|nr:hypothetical protein [Clostridia bacterium]